MSRNIKFKLYYQNQVFGYEWLDETGWHHSVIDLVKESAGTLPHNWAVNDYKKLVRAQFTGLYDSKNNEIYQGDIVENEKYGKTKNFLVKWGADKHGWRGIESKSVLIIGNQYENPELLN